jgi:hypothetical protein
MNGACIKITRMMIDLFLSISRTHALALLAVLFLAFGDSASRAQSMPWINPQVLSTTTGTDVMSVVLQNHAASANRTNDETDAAPANAVTTNGRDVTGIKAIIDYRYRSSPTRTQQNLRSFVAQAPNQATRDDLERMLAEQPTLMDDIAAGVRAYGFDPHNVADAYAVWWINVWGASEKRNIEPDAATVAAVKQQVYAAFEATPDYATTSDADRQEYAEALLLQASMLGSAFEQMKNDPKMLDQLAEAARMGAKAQGLDLSKMTLTPSGFVPRKGS